MFRHCIFCVLLLLPTSSYARMVGGACTYELVYGTARIIEQKNATTFLQFNPEGQHSIDSALIMPGRMKFPAQLPVAGGVGAMYPAELSVISKGSCSPYHMRILANESHRTGAFIELENDGQLTSAGQLKLSQLAVIFKKLIPKWPQLHLEICGQTTPEGTEEYNLNLGEFHARKIAHQLEQQGVPAPQIKTFSFGEQLCPQGTELVNGLQNGAWLSFLLIDPDSRKNEEGL